MDFGQPNVEIGRKMANGQLLFLVLFIVFCVMCMYMLTFFHKGYICDGVLWRGVLSDRV